MKSFIAMKNNIDFTQLKNMRGSFQTFKNIGPYKSQIVLEQMFDIVEGTFLISHYEICKTRQVFLRSIYFGFIN